MNYSVNLDITPGGMPPVLHMSQYDTDRQYTVNLKDGGLSYSLGTGATGKVKGFNGKACFEIEATASGSTVTFQLTDASTDQFGIFPVTLELTNDGDTISPLCMIFDVQRAGYTNEQAASSPEFENAMEAEAKKYVLGMDAAARSALLDLLAYAAYTGPDAQSKLDTLETALQGKLSYIIADYAQDRTVYDTDSLDILKEGDDLIVTAYYTDGTHADLADSQYTLSGTLTVGTSTITVTYLGKTDTISVEVTAYPYRYVEYIETDGACRIDTGVAFDATKDLKVTLEASVNVGAGTDAYTTGWNAGGTIGAGNVSTGTPVYHWYDGNTTSSSATLGGVDELTTCEMTIQAGSASNTVSVYTNTQGTKTLTRTHPNVANRTFLQNFPLFATSGQNDYAYSKEGLRIKSATFVQGTTTKTLKACYRRSDNVIGFYDEVNDVFHTNQGTGTFRKGADI